MESESSLPVARKEELRIKDVGYAWIVVGAMFMSNILTAGYIKAFGVIYNAITDVYVDASGTMAGLMIGLLAGCRTLFAPLAGAIGNMIGIRTTMCLGTSLCVCGLMASCFCTSVLQLAFTLGAMTGMGHCLIESCQVVVISEYFESKLPLANGVRVAGNPCGGVVYPIMVTLLLHQYGLKMHFLMLAGVTMHIYVCSLLMRPIKIHTKIQISNLVDSKLKETSNPEEGRHLQAYYNSEFESVDLQTRRRTLYNSIINQNEENSNIKKKKLLEFSLLRNVNFLFFILMAAGVPMGLGMGLYYTTIYAKTVVGLSPYEISFLLSFQAIFDIILRIFLGWLNNKNLYKQEYGLIFGYWCSALGYILIPQATDLKALIFPICLYSFGPASFHCFVSVILGAQFGKDTLATSWGFVRMTQGIFSFVHPALIGYVLDWTGTYTIPFLLMGLGMLFCSLMVIIETVIRKCCNSSSEIS